MRHVRTALKWIWTALKFIGRWLGPVLIALSVYLWLFPPLAFVDFAASNWPTGAIIAAIACLLMRAPERRTHRKILAVVALAGLAFWGWRYSEAKSGYRTEIVSFDSQGAKLVGTLYLPDRPGKFPGIVFVHGSGSAPRWTNESYATHFARAGYAVLLYDKRGTGDSGGRYEWTRNYCPDNLDLLASDASAALSLVAKRPEVRADAAGLMGVSQAGWIVPRAAVKNKNAAFMLLFAGPTTSTHAIVKQERFRLGQIKDDDTLGARKSFILIGSGGPNIPKGMTPDEAYELAQKTSPELLCPDLDPMQDLRALGNPGLWVLGEKDWIVPIGATSANLDILRELGKPYEYRMMPGAGHLLNGQANLVEDTVDEWLAQVTAPGPN